MYVRVFFYVFYRLKYFYVNKYKVDAQQMQKKRNYFKKWYANKNANH